MTALAYTPTYPVPGRAISAVFSLTESGTNFVRVWCTEAPDGSELDKKLQAPDSDNARIDVYEGDGGAKHPLDLKLDKGGKYTFVAQEYTKGSTFTGGYQNDPRGATVETPVGTEAELIIYVGRRTANTCGVSPDTAQVVFWSWADTIRATSVAIHGEKTPAILNPSTPRAKSAALNTDVTDALDALVGVTIATAFGGASGLTTALTNYGNQFDAHIPYTTSSTHDTADTDNAVTTEFFTDATPASIATFVLECLRRLRQHMTNDSGSGYGSATSAYHQLAGNDLADLTNLPLVRSVSSAEDAYVAFADLWRAYEAHRVNTAVHGAADNVNDLDALPKLLDVHRYFFAALASAAPTAGPGDTNGAALLNNWGIKTT